MPARRKTSVILTVLWCCAGTLTLVLVAITFYQGGRHRFSDPSTASLASLASQDVVTAFQKVYTYSQDQPWRQTSWLGVQTLKIPSDLWIFQEILQETRPDVLIETGTYQGGSALFFASLFDLLNNGRVVTIDIAEQSNKPKHPRITYLIGSSTSDRIVSEVRRLTEGAGRIMVTLDSDHNAAHVLQELRIYSNFVTPGCFLVVEDTALNGHPVWPNFGPGPMEALETFLQQDKNFVPDRSREKFLVTGNPKGYLRRNK